MRLVELGIPLAQGYRFARPAPAMELLNEDTREMLAQLRRTRESDGVGRLVEPCPAVEANTSRAALAELFVKDPQCSAVTLLDGHGRPARIALRDSFLRAEQPRRISLYVEPIRSLGDVARRAIARADGERFDPIVCCDERRHLLGIVRVERLIEALAR